jgi:hypothetical protein
MYDYPVSRLFKINEINRLQSFYLLFCFYDFLKNKNIDIKIKPDEVLSDILQFKNLIFNFLNKIWGISDIQMSGPAWQDGLTSEEKKIFVRMMAYGFDIGFKPFDSDLLTVRIYAPIQLDSTPNDVNIQVCMFKSPFQKEENSIKSDYEYFTSKNRAVFHFGIDSSDFIKYKNDYNQAAEFYYQQMNNMIIESIRYAVIKID